MRALAVLLHRWVGLVLAGFLLLAGLTGALLAWNEPLDATINPHLFRPPAPAAGAVPLDPLQLREQVQALHPNAWVHTVPLAGLAPHGAAAFWLEAATDPATGQAAVLQHDQVFVDTHTGQVLGQRLWGDIGQGLTNLMPFLYRLHYSLALGTVGTTVFGIVALLWTLDCFVGAWLTLPRSHGGGGVRRWWARWTTAWQVRRGAGAYRTNLDLHRAGGLWLWALLFVFAWSSVSFNLHDEVYRPVMGSLFEQQADPRHTWPVLERPEPEPAMGWAQGLATGRRHAAALAREHGFAVLGEDLLQYDPRKGLFRLRVRTDRDRNAVYGLTPIWFDARTGALAGFQLPTGAAAGDTVTHWLQALHTGHVGGLPYRVLVSLTGLGLAVLSVTGVVVWLVKRRARRAAQAVKAHGLGAMS